MSPLKSHYEDMPADEVSRRIREIDLQQGSLVRALPPAHDPIFTPLFTAVLGAGGFGLSGTALSIGVGLASAVSAGGDYWEVAYDGS